MAGGDGRSRGDRFLALTEALSLGIYEADRDGKLTFANARWCEIAGWSIERAMSSPWIEAIHPDDRAMVLATLRGRFTGEVESGQLSSPFRVVHDDGVEVWVRSSSTLLRDEAGEVTGYVGFVLDVTAIKLREQAERASEARIRELNEDLQRRNVQLEQANRELESFSYSVSHDLRAPLRTIDGFSLAVLNEHGDALDATARGHLARVRRATQTMGQLIDDLLLLARVTRSEIREGRVDLGAMAEETVARLRAAHPAREVEVVVAPGLLAWGDGPLLRTLLDNLLDNAWKYTGKRARARVEIGARDEGGERIFFVRDDGAGFDMTYAGKLFNAFQRLHTEREFPGTGIGLATAARIVGRHGGRIWAVGAPGEGATFSFVLGSSPGGAAR